MNLIRVGNQWQLWSLGTMLGAQDCDPEIPGHIPLVVYPSWVRYCLSGRTVWAVFCCNVCIGRVETDPFVHGSRRLVGESVVTVKPMRGPYLTRSAAALAVAEDCGIHNAIPPEVWP